MLYPVYSVHDALVGYQAPTLMNNDAFAMRNFAEVFDDVKNPQDYSLWLVGHFDTDTGELQYTVPTVVCRATDFIKDKE